MFGISAFSEAPFSALAGGDSANVSVTLTGQSATGAVGSFTFVGKANVTPASQVGTSALGTTSQVGEGNVVPSGQVGTGDIAGVGVNGSVVAILPSVSANVGSVSVSTDAEANVTPAGQTSTSVVGSLSTVAAANVFASTDTEAVGAANSAVGSITINGIANIDVDGQTGTSALGTPSTACAADVSASGLILQATLNNPSTRTQNVISVSGLSSTSGLGSLLISAKANIIPVGQVGTVGTPVVLVWGEIDDSQTPNYSSINTTQSPNYTSVSDAQSPNWEEVA